MASLNEYGQRGVRLHGGATMMMKNCAKKSTGRCVFLLDQKSTEEMHRLKPQIMEGRNPLITGWLECRKPKERHSALFPSHRRGRTMSEIERPHAWANSSLKDIDMPITSDKPHQAT